MKRYVVEGGVARKAVIERDPKYESPIYNYKCREDSIGSPAPSPTNGKQEPSKEETFGNDSAASPQNCQKSPHGDSENSDNGSEVSDEGYRSLGAVQSSTANGNSASSAQSSPTVADCQSKFAGVLRRFLAL